MEKLRVYFRAMYMDKASALCQLLVSLRDPPQPSPSAGSGGEFGLQLLVGTVLSQHGEGDWQAGK